MGGTRPSAAPGGRKGRGRDASRWWAGPARAGWRACGGGKERRESAAGLGLRGPVAGGPLGVLKGRVWI
jgi:hypothetical protein